jgi:uncharacterized protein with HEPN domain
VSRDWLLYLDDLIDSAEKIGRFMAGLSFDAFTADEAIFDAVLFNLQVIGEAVKRLPADARAAMPEAESAGPARLRDLIAHHYFALDAEIIWEVATIRVPKILAEARNQRTKAETNRSNTGKPA